jgi:eight-cysteine-cluster-containing protein
MNLRPFAALAALVLSPAALAFPCPSGDTTYVVHGAVELTGTVPDLSNALITIGIDDVSLADAPSVRIAEITLRGVQSSPIDFNLSGCMNPEGFGRDYTVSVHVDLNGDRTIDAGDFITMESFPVLRDIGPSDEVVHDFVNVRAHPVEAPSAKECLPNGCSGQVCADEPVFTTCEWRPEYACFQQAACERQVNGACGWTQTAELQACLEAARRQ